jgi:hypothetical protein
LVQCLPLGNSARPARRDAHDVWIGGDKLRFQRRLPTKPADALTPAFAGDQDKQRQPTCGLSPPDSGASGDSEIP